MYKRTLLISQGRHLIKSSSGRNYVWDSSQETFLTDPREPSSSHIDILSLHDSTTKIQIATCSDLEIWVAGWGVRFVVFESVQVLVALAAHFAPVWLFFLHAHCPGVRRRGFGVDD